MSDVREASAPAMNQQNRAGPNPVGDFIWYELMTPDAEAAKAFYDAVVGWDFGESVEEYQGYRMINTRDGGFAGGVMPITPEMQQHGARPTWLGYLNVSDVDEKVAAIEAAGGTHFMTHDIPNVGRIAMVADPQGAQFYVMKPIPPEGRENEPSTVFSPRDRGHCAWNELSTSDPQAARRFYGEQFGWTTDNFMPMGEHGEYRFIDHQGLTLGAIAGTMGAPQPPHWRFYFRVPSVGNAKDTAEAKGGKIVMGPMEVPGGDHIVIGIDPQGAEFALVGQA